VNTPAVDKLCGHYSSYTESVQHMTCSCNALFNDFGKHCQKQHKTFANQVAVYLSDSFVVEKLGLCSDLMKKMMMMVQL
jgi:hypothetical protein